MRKNPSISTDFKDQGSAFCAQTEVHGEQAEAEAHLIAEDAHVLRTARAVPRAHNKDELGTGRGLRCICWDFSFTRGPYGRTDVFGVDFCDKVSFKPMNCSKMDGHKNSWPPVLPLLGAQACNATCHKSVGTTCKANEPKPAR
eukprot:1152400-Pelagomonas_calceolata.AAC.2